MIICPKCNNKLSTNNRSWFCCRCSFNVVKEDGIIIFNRYVSNFEDYHPLGLDILFKADEEKHFWFKNRRNIIKSIFERYVGKNETIIEIGAGTGFIASEIYKNGYNIAVGDIYKHGLKYIKNFGIKNLFQFDLMNPPFKEHFDVVCLFDVLEHIEDDSLAIKNIHRILKTNGKIIVTIPAHMWLWSRHDAISYHKRRYEIKKIKNLFVENKFDFLVAKSFFVTILPFLYLRHLIKRDNQSPVTDEEIKKYKISINPIINFVLDKISFFESILFNILSPPFGSSIIAVGRKII